MGRIDSVLDAVDSLAKYKSLEAKVGMLQADVSFMHSRSMQGIPPTGRLYPSSSRWNQHYTECHHSFCTFFSCTKKALNKLGDWLFNNNKLLNEHNKSRWSISKTLLWLRCGSVGWSIVPYTKRLGIWFPLRAHMGGNQLSFSLPLSLYIYISFSSSFSKINIHTSKNKQETPQHLHSS